MGKLSSKGARPINRGQAPKLAVLMGGSTEVNAARARSSSSVAVRPSPSTNGGTASVRLLSRAEVAEQVKNLPDHPGPPDVDFSLFVELERDLDPVASADVLGEIRRIATRTRAKQDAATVQVRGGDVRRLLEVPGVSYAEPGQPLRTPEPVVGDRVPRRPSLDLRRVSAQAKRHRYGQDVLVGIIDVGGFDFTHEDFLNGDGTTRWAAIWDQGGQSRPSPAESGPEHRQRARFDGLDYGSEILGSHMDAAIAGARTRGMSAAALEPQSQTMVGSHGTHVASIAAGNRGVARRAKIAGVLVSLRPEDLDSSSTFYDSTRIADAVDYLVTLAMELGGQDGPLPVAINISLGTNGHAHDTSSAIARWIDHALTIPGRCVCVAAGNAGQVEPESPDDVGHMMGRIHASGSLAGADLTHELGWIVAGGAVADVSENELEIWYKPQDRLVVEIRPPGGRWLDPISPGDFIRNDLLENGTVLSVYNETYVPANGLNRISVLLSPFFGPVENGTQAVGPIAGGEWRVRLTGKVVRDGRYDAWIERDDPRQLPTQGRSSWQFPSFFADDTCTDDRMISSLACAERLVAVANLDIARSGAHVTSSRGPTRDGGTKPDLGAPGTDIVAANGFDRERRWVGMTGTSMASPYACGVSALMLGISPRLTSSQILGIMRTKSRPLPGHDYNWRKDTGFGAIDAAQCVDEAVWYEDCRKRAQQ